MECNGPERFRHLGDHDEGEQAKIAKAKIGKGLLSSVPTVGNDVLLYLGCVAAGAVMGCLAGLFTHLRRDTGGLVWGRAGWVPASLWVTGMGARMAFVFAAYNGLGPAIGHFSAAHDITSSKAWVAALVMMALADVLTRLAVLFVRSRRLAAAPAAVPAAPAAVPVTAVTGAHV